MNFNYVETLFFMEFLSEIIEQILLYLKLKVLKV